MEKFELVIFPAVVIFIVTLFAKFGSTVDAIALR